LRLEEILWWFFYRGAFFIFFCVGEMSQSGVVVSCHMMMRRRMGGERWSEAAYRYQPPPGAVSRRLASRRLLAYAASHRVRDTPREGLGFFCVCDCVCVCVVGEKKSRLWLGLLFVHGGVWERETKRKKVEQVRPFFLRVALTTFFFLFF